MKKLIDSCNVTIDGFMSGPGGTQDSLRFIANEPELERDGWATSLVDDNAAMPSQVRAYDATR